MVKDRMSETPVNNIENGSKSADIIKPKKDGFLEFVRRHYRGLSVTTAIIAIFAVTGKAYDHYVLEPARPAQQNYESPTFDSAALDTHINANNSVQMTLSEYEKIAPPVWEEQSKTMTIPLPIRFRGDRIPNLQLKKSPDIFGGARPGNDMIEIYKGLEMGDTIFSPYNGKLMIEINPDGSPKPTQQSFFLDVGPQDNYERIWFQTTPVQLLINSNNVTREDETFGSVPIKKNQLIGEIIGSNPNVKIIGLSYFTQEKFNLATSPNGKAITLK